MLIEFDRGKRLKSNVQLNQPIFGEKDKDKSKMRRMIIVIVEKYVIQIL